MIKRYEVIGNTPSAGGPNHNFETGTIVTASTGMKFICREEVVIDPLVDGYFTGKIEGLNISLEQVVALKDLKEVV